MVKPGLFLLAAALVTPAFGADGDAGGSWFLNIGPGVLRPSTKTSIELPPGTTLPGAGVAVENGKTLAVETGYDFTRTISARLTVGVPITTKLMATGTAAALGEAGSVSYGPAVLSCTYRFQTPLGLTPYLGLGAAYMLVTKTKDGTVSDLKVKDAWGSEVEAGLERPLKGRYGLFLNVKKIFLKTTATGTVPAFGNAPAKVNVTLDPLIIHAGASIRF